MTYTVAKINKRLWIVKGEDLVYTPPDHIRHKMVDRGMLEATAIIFNAKGYRCIETIIAFESAY